ncbi:MAG: Bordetella phage vB BbrM [Planctomycetota bacterium]
MITAADIDRRLREKYPLADGWITMGEVTPPGTSRRFDLIAIMGWNSRGHEALGFEVKVSRGDWLRELKDPAKAEPLVRLCSRWWIVAPPGVVEVEELPPAWGLQVVHESVIRVAKQAPQLNPEPWSPAVWRCMMLRQATREARTPDDLERAKREGAAAGAEEWRKMMDAQEERHRTAMAELRATIEAAEKATGVRLNRYTDFPALGEAMKMLQVGGHSEIVRKLENDARLLREGAIRMRLAARALRQRPGSQGPEHPSA